MLCRPRSTATVSTAGPPLPKDEATLQRSACTVRKSAFFKPALRGCGGPRLDACETVDLVADSPGALKEAAGSSRLEPDTRKNVPHPRPSNGYNMSKGRRLCRRPSGDDLAYNPGPSMRTAGNRSVLIHRMIKVWRAGPQLSSSGGGQSSCHPGSAHLRPDYPQRRTPRHAHGRPPLPTV